MNYNKLAKFYNKFTYDVNYEKMISFYKTLMDKSDYIFKDILELGCGTGNITSKLSGYNIYALDYSEEMLSIAREKMGNKRNVRLFQMDIRDFNFNKKFDLVIAALDVINYIVEIEDLKKIFRNVKNHMKEESIFIFDINTEYKISEYIGNNIFSDEIDEGLYIWQGNYDKNTNINEYLLTFFIEDKNDKYDRFSEFHKERAYSINEIKKILLDSGFKNIKIYDDFEFKEINDKTLRATFVAN